MTPFAVNYWGVFYVWLHFHHSDDLYDAELDSSKENHDEKVGISIDTVLVHKEV